MYELLSPKMDFVFKKIFGSEEDKEILISFLNSVLEEEIKDVKIKNTDIEKDYLYDKFSRLEVKATDNKGNIINIEIQVKNQNDMKKRTLYYWSKLYTEMNVRDVYNRLNKVICINILDFNYLKEESNFHNVYKLCNINNKNSLNDEALELHFIELPKLKLKENEELSKLELWLEFLKNPEGKIVREKEETNKVIRRAKDKLCYLSQSEEERTRYEFRRKTILDENSALNNSFEKGIEKGRLDTLIENVKNLFESNLSIEVIAKSLKLSEEDVKKYLES